MKICKLTAANHFNVVTYLCQTAPNDSGKLWHYIFIYFLWIRRICSCRVVVLVTPVAICSRYPFVVDIHLAVHNASHEFFLSVFIKMPYFSQTEFTFFLGWGEILLQESRDGSTCLKRKNHKQEYIFHECLAGSLNWNKSVPHWTAQILFSQATKGVQTLV